MSIIARLQQLFTSLGLKSDAADPNGSLHAKTKDVKSALDTVNTSVTNNGTNLTTVKTNVGSDADASSASGSVHGKLKDVKATATQIAGYVDTLETTLGTVSTNVNTVNTNVNTVNTSTATINTKIGANTDAAGTNTLFARTAQIANYVDTVEGSLGQTGDAASATGTAHAKLADIKNTVTAIPTTTAKARTTRKVSVDVLSGDGTRTILDVYGKGRILLIQCSWRQTSSNRTLRVSIDNVEVNYVETADAYTMGFDRVTTQDQPPFTANFKERAFITVENWSGTTASTWDIWYEIE